MTDAEKIAALESRLKVLERVVEIMSGYINGFGSVGHAKAKRSAEQRTAELRAATARFS